MTIPFNTVDVVSFDLFDTLLLRPLVDPHDIWMILEHREGMRGFYAARCDADQGGFSAIDDMYEKMPPSFASMKEMELELEEELLVANDEMLELWREAGKLGKRRIIVSDMYLSAEFLGNVLQKNGFDGWNALYVSCERKARKDTGALFKTVLRDLQVPASSVIHIGDNQLSDVKMAAACGMQTHWYERPLNRVLRENHFLRKFYETDLSFSRRCLVGAVATQWHNYRFSHPQCGYWGAIGCLLGGVLGVAYLSMVVREARRRGIHWLMMVARDGYSMEKILQRIAPDIKTTYFYAPRCVDRASDAAIRQDYFDYVAGLGVHDTDEVAVVDSVSMTFTAQRLLSDALGRQVYGFSFVALRPPQKGACFVKAVHLPLGWCHLAEFLFSAPTPPVIGVRNKEPLYLDPCPENEHVKILVRRDVSDAEVACADRLHAWLGLEGVSIDPEMWLDYIDSFVDNVTREDRQKMSRVKNGVDELHSRYEPILDFDGMGWKWFTWKKIPYKLQRKRRLGMKLFREDYAFGLFKFRTQVEDLESGTYEEY